MDKIELKEKFYRDLNNSNVLLNYLQEIFNSFGATVQLNNDKKFDLIFLNNNVKLEVKQEIKTNETNNIAIEYSYKNYPSGIFSTDAEYWVHFFLYKNRWFCVVYNVKELREELKNSNFKKVIGGDNNYSKMFLINVLDALKLKSLIFYCYLPKFKNIYKD